jgi:hypothetical protein
MNQATTILTCSGAGAACLTASRTTSRPSNFCFMRSGPRTNDAYTVKENSAKISELLDGFGTKFQIDFT